MDIAAKVINENVTFTVSAELADTNMAVSVSSSRKTKPTGGGHDTEDDEGFETVISKRSKKVENNTALQTIKMSRLDHWVERWNAGRTGWHNESVHFFLLEYASTILTKKKRIFVPLSGKSIDVKWFYEKGHNVVAVEGVEIAIKEFFEETKISHVIKKTSKGKLYESDDSRLQIYVQDLFDLEDEDIGVFDFIWDRGSLVAIYLEDRKRYAALLKRLFAPGCQYFVATVEYDGVETKSGPPRCVTEQQLEDLFGDTCSMKLLTKGIIPVSMERFGYEVFIKKAIMLTPKII